MRLRSSLFGFFAIASVCWPTWGHAQVLVAQYGPVKFGPGVSPFTYGPFLAPAPVYTRASFYGPGYVYTPEVSQFVYGYTPLHGSSGVLWPNYTYPQGFVVTYGAVPAAASYTIRRSSFVRPLVLHEVLYAPHRHKKTRSY